MRQDLMLTGVLTLFFGGFTVMAIAMPLQSAIAPVMANGTGFLLGLFVLLRNLRHTETEEISAYSGKDVMSVATLALALIMVINFGFYVGAPIYVFVHIYFFKKHSIFQAILATGFMLLFLYVVFNQFLGIPLFEGLVLENFGQ